MTNQEDQYVILDNIRCVSKQIPLSEKVLCSIAILILGIVLGISSKFLDTTASNELPFIIESLDFRNFFGRLAIWILIAVCISIYSNSAIRAAINVFVFFVGMVTSYYLYSKFIAGFFPRSYAMIWFGITAISPLVGFCLLVCKGRTQNISYPFLNFNRSFIQYDICLWMDLFRHLFHLRSDSFYLRISNFKT